MEEQEKYTFSEYDYWNEYNIVKDSSADLGVNFKIVQNRPTVTKLRLWRFNLYS